MRLLCHSDKKNFAFLSALALWSGMAAGLCEAQTTVTYTDGQDRSAPIALAGNETVTLSIASGTATQSGLISGWGNLVKSGNGALVFANVETYVGTTSVDAGSLVIGASGVSGKIDAGSDPATGNGYNAVTVQSGGTLVVTASEGLVYGGNAAGGDSRIGGTGVVVLSGGSFQNAGAVVGGTGRTAGVGAAVTLASGAAFSNTGLIRGGAGESGLVGYSGGAGLILSAQSDITNSGTIAGGAGGTGQIPGYPVFSPLLAGKGGIGAVVTLASGADFTNDGSISGGGAAFGLRINSARAVTNRGAISGGIAILKAETFVNESTITGYDGLAAMDGGVGALLNLSGGVTLSSASVISGGKGSPSIAALGVPASNGGAGLILITQGDVINDGVITGGLGGHDSISPGQGGAGAKIMLGSAADFTNNGAISGGGSALGLQIDRARTVTNNNTISGGVSLQSTQSFVNNGTVTGSVVGGGSLSVVNKGSITGTVILAGGANTLALFPGSSLGGIFELPIGPALTLVLDGADSEIFSSAVTDATGFRGSLIKQGAGTWTLDHSLGYHGTTTITEGTLVAANATGSATGSSAISVRGAGVLAGTGAVSGPVTIGAGGTVEGSLNIGGATTIGSGGLLRGTLTVSGDLSVLTGGTLGGAPMLGVVTMADGANLSPGETSSATINAGSLTLSNSTNVIFDLGASSDLVNVSGALSLDGVLRLTTGAGFGTGPYRLFNYGGALTDHGLALGLVPGGYTFSIAAGGGAVDLVVSYDGLAFWNGGGGTWNDENTNWTNFDSSSSLPWIPGTAVFRTADTVTVSGTQTITGLQFSAAAMLAGSGALDIGASGAELRVDEGISAAVGVSISGSGGITKSGGGSLTLSQPNTFTGTVSINSGTLHAAGDSALGDAANAITFHDGTLHYAGSATTSRAISILSTATFDVDDGATLSLLGLVSGGGNLVKTGAGTLEFGTTPGYTGGTTVTAGTLDTNDHDLATRFLAGAGTLDLGSGDLTLNGATDATFSGTLVSTGALNKTGSATQTLSGMSTLGSVHISGGILRAGSAGGLTSGIFYTVEGDGTLDLDGHDLTVSSLGGDGSGAKITLGTATLTVDQSADTTFAGAITGTGNPLATAGSLVKTGAGQLTLGGQSTLAGSTVVRGGTLFLGSGASLQNSSYGAVDTGGSVIVEGAWSMGDSLNVGMMGAASVTIRNGGTVTTAVDGLLGASFAPSTVTVTGEGSSWKVGSAILIGGPNNGAQGTLNIFDNAKVESGSVLMGTAPMSTAALTISGGGTLATAFIEKVTPPFPSSTAILTIDGGTLRATGDQGDYLRGFAPGDVTIAAGGLAFDTSYDATDEAGDPVVAGASVTINAPLDGAGGLTKTGLGTLILESANTYTGSTIVAAGTLLVSGSITSDVTVQSGATFGGGGLIEGGITLEAGSTLAPVDCLDADSLIWNAGAALVFTLGAAGSSDIIELDGNLMMDGTGAFAFTFTDAGWQVGETYTLITFAGTNFSEGDFSYTNGGGFYGAFTLSGHDLQFTLAAVPEPSTLALMAAALLAMVCLRRRRTFAS